ncbi:MAG: bifunctional acetate--CoA ligase family protein/GNAT family N-acetyltransferase, partial [Nitrososphaerales archaeon]
MRAGKHATGAKAASSHTGALAGDYQVYEAAFKRADAVQVSQIEDLFDCASVLDSKSLPAGSRLGIVTNAGGSAVLVSDFIADYGVDLVKLSDESKSVLDVSLPKFWSRGNPVDILGDAGVDRYELALKTCNADPN